MPPPRTRRSDAERNRDTILAVARAAFADPEADISMAEIARRAGVGMATLYRNFPGRRELLEALYIDEVDAVCRAAETLQADTPAGVLMAWLREFFAFFNSKRHVADEFLKASGDRALFGTSRARVLAAGRPLLLAAQRSGEVRDDLTLEQVLDLVAGVGRIEGGPSYVEPILQAALAGLRAPVI